MAPMFLAFWVPPARGRAEFNRRKQKRRPKAPFRLSPRNFNQSNRLLADAMRGFTVGLKGESPWPGASTTTTLPGFTRL